MTGLEIALATLLSMAIVALVIVVRSKPETEIRWYHLSPHGGTSWCADQFTAVKRMKEAEVAIRQEASAAGIRQRDEAIAQRLEIEHQRDELREDLRDLQQGKRDENAKYRGVHRLLTAVLLDGPGEVALEHGTIDATEGWRIVRRTRDGVTTLALQSLDEPVDSEGYL